ncbi:hypothetical protein IZU99_06155 [Oscillospiraceae bacterium CM]|nr:hypothetical protein IZU99_06155 [Oscillospiraceae bacterium CM]
MSLIPCTGDCVYQADGCCGLERAASKGIPEPSGENCVHFIRKNKQATALDGESIS